MKLTFESKISGTRVDGYEGRGYFHGQIALLSKAMKLKSQAAMDYLLDKFRFSRIESGEHEGDWVAVIGYDDDYKINILENYPEVAEQLEEYFGKDWVKCYIRFGH